MKKSNKQEITVTKTEIELLVIKQMKDFTDHIIKIIEEK